MVCPNMKITTLGDVLQVLEKEDNEVEVPEEVRKGAVVALERMLDLA
jgi:quinolinate synthase